MTNKNEKISQNRRDVLIGAGAVGLGVLAAAATSTTTAWAESMEGHHHHAVASQTKDLAKALHHCVATSEACIDHCLDMFKSGDTTLAECAAIVQETMAFCEAHAKLASYNSIHLKAMNELGIKVCEVCEKECRKHKKHALCQECADACIDCIKACKAYTA